MTRPWLRRAGRLGAGTPPVQRGSGLDAHDHLGSLVSASDSGGIMIAGARYWPFGGQRQLVGSFPTDRLFTGQVRDLGNDGFYFFRARHYDAGVARFFQPDPAPPAWKNSLTINPYAYALNNPLRLEDPTGRDSNDPNDPTVQWFRSYEASHHGQWPSFPEFLAWRLSRQLGGAWTSADWRDFDKFAQSLLATSARDTGLVTGGAAAWLAAPAHPGATADQSSRESWLDHLVRGVEGYVVGKAAGRATKVAIDLLNPAHVVPVQYLNQYDQVLTSSFERLPGAAIRLVPEVVGRLPFTGVDEGTIADITRSVAQLAGVGEGASGFLGSGLGAALWFFATPGVAYSD